VRASVERKSAGDERGERDGVRDGQREHAGERAVQNASGHATFRGDGLAVLTAGNDDDDGDGDGDRTSEYTARAPATTATPSAE
jgi:hypothetical protein